jgi:hypothetical protein
MGTHWELKRNIIVGWEPGKNEKKSSPKTLSQKLKRRKKAGHLECMLGGLPIIGCMKFSLPKRVHHHFWTGLIQYPLQRTPYLFTKTRISMFCDIIFKKMKSIK